MRGSKTETRIVEGGIIEKKCNRCGSFKKLTEFGLDITKFLGHRNWCKECVRDYASNDYKKRRVFLREYALDRVLIKFNLTREKYNKLIAGGCAICGRIDEEFHIDHCHKTNKFRGILCESCNRGLGFFKDNSNTLLRAAVYLEKFNKIEELDLASEKRENER